MLFFIASYYNYTHCHYQLLYQRNHNCVIQFNLDKSFVVPDSDFFSCFFVFLFHILSLDLRGR